MRDHLRFISDNARILGFGALHSFFSSPGQAFFISAYVSYFAASFGLAPADMGLFFLLATAGSAGIMVLVGAQIDRLSLRLYCLMTSAGMAAACFTIAGAQNALVLCAGILVLRLTGQSLMAHIEATATARAFDTRRGKALSTTSLGLSLGEALLPPGAALLNVAVGWRGSFALIGLCVLVVLLPLGQLLAPKSGATAPASDVLVRAEAGSRILIRSVFFWRLIPIILVLPVFGTAVIFHIQYIAGISGTSPQTVAFLFLFFAGGGLLGLFLSGPAIDNWSARYLARLFTIPLLAGFAIFAVAPHPLSIAFLLGTTGITNGLARATVTAVLAEVYGVRQIGALRSFVMTLIVLGSAVGPLLVGLFFNVANPQHILFAIVAVGTAAHLPYIFAEIRRQRVSARQPEGGTAG